ENNSRENLLEALERRRTLAETRERAYTYAEQAKKNLEILPVSRYRSALDEIPSYMIERAK
ncbi:MAG TPA: hypothetical protein VGB68_04090, partial [Pyrinomonadaceae bacterium]